MTSQMSIYERGYTSIGGVARFSRHQTQTRKTLKELTVKIRGNDVTERITKFHSAINPPSVSKVIDKIRP